MTAFRNEKYESTGETMELCGVTLYQIRAVKAFGVLAAGALGGWIAGDANLSVSGNAWVYGNARVYGDAQVSGDAQVYGNARVSLQGSITTISGIGSRNATLTVTFDAKIGVRYTTGCFSGSRAELMAAVEKTHFEGSIYRGHYWAAITAADYIVKEPS